MDLDEFEVQYRNAMDDVLNQMQTVVLLLAQAETETVRIGESIQNIRQMVDRFLVNQRQGNAERAVSDLSALKTAERELEEVLLRSPAAELPRPALSPTVVS